ncbi:DUF4350 domain-containing protein [Chamaesiphon sp. OTE_20_metabat_361]|uniref:DUF4350 domain-containing protein n=1 Tax=Chamaesiphon sp. OTE_20_metabat_361 TaxID=2964689 RepID=UPI00286A3F23|nr:DUF4350 domain-containing protein [Chamaesiphon sp. OTE_20_metabat_361]
MTDFNKLFKQYWHLGLFAVFAIVLVTFISAMGGDPRQVGSSYSIAPNGYSAWYQMMSDRGIKIRRWHRSFPRLTQDARYETGTTLLQVNHQLALLELTDLQQKWVSKGNTLAILGVTAPATDIPFRSSLESPQGDVKIETTRRFRSDLVKTSEDRKLDPQSILSDRTGSVVRQFKLDKGLIIIATTPNLAANTYQDLRPNFELLAEIVTKDRQQVLVDEYIHGYVSRKSSAIAKNRKQRNGEPGGSVEGSADPDDTSDDEEDGSGSESDKGDLLDYLTNTPLLVAFLNLSLGTLALIWQQNRRFGKVTIPKPIEIENSQAYIQALGGVLYQANSSEFVVQNIGRAKQLSWQQRLGLGKERLVETEIAIAAWENQTQLPADDLRFVLQLMSERRPTPAQLTTWLEKIRQIDSRLTKL